MPLLALNRKDTAKVWDGRINWQEAPEVACIA
jgi:hypothetical protein